MLSHRSHHFLRTSRARNYHRSVNDCLKRPVLIPDISTKDVLLQFRETGLQPASEAIVVHKGQTRAFTRSISPHYATPISEVTPSQSEQTPLAESSEALARAGNVREYLRQWSSQNQQRLDEHEGNGVASYSYQAALPNSVFGKQEQKPSPDDVDEHRIAEEAANDISGDDAYAGKSLREIYPGDLFFMNISGIHQQYAIYLGHCDYQAQYLLSDGRWFVHTQTQWNGYVLRNFATDDELAMVRPFFPSQPVEHESLASDNNHVSVHLAGDVPLFASASLLAKMKSLTYQIEEYKRRYGQVLTRFHEAVAHESLFKLLTLNDILKQHFDVDHKSAPEALKMMIIDHFSESFALLPLVSRETYTVSVMPKRLSRAIATTTDWARQYQDAAARAAMGKDVTQELQKNPLTSFISKARRLITKSRKIRLPMLGTFIGPTLSDKKPSDPTIHRVKTGETFDASDRLIIDFLWLTYVKLPKATASTSAQQMSIGSLILRAVGAYPTLTLESTTGQIFLAELGCLEPWFDRCDHSVLAPVSILGLNHDVCVAKEESDKALTQLKTSWDGTGFPFPDTMSKLRRDWGDMEVFAIDKVGTVIVDDGISLEPSDDHPDHHWIHLHFAHLSAFLPFDHAFRNCFGVMEAGHYSPLGNEPALPMEVVLAFGVGPNKPVLTVSTLLAQDGSVKKVEISSGTIHNVISMNPTALERITNGVGSIAEHRLRVGNVATAGKYTTSPTQPTDISELRQKYGSKLCLLQELLVARWHARYRENPDHLKMLRIPKPISSTYVNVGKNFDRHHSRIYRSEHCVGDPEVSLRTRLRSLECLHEDQPERRDLVTGAMLLAQESAGLWLRQRNVPAIYRYSATRANYDIEKLNKLGRYDGFIGPSGGDSVIPSRHVILATAQLSVVTNPLRRHLDLLNHYNIDAYLKAEAVSPGQNMATVEYPMPLATLIKYIREKEPLKTAVSLAGKSHHHWMVHALLRAHTFGEAKLPEVWDLMVGNPLVISRAVSEKDVFYGKLLALDIPVTVRKSAEGWEAGVKFRQYLPVKLVEINSAYDIICEAVGPPSDNPIVNNGSSQHAGIGLDDTVDADTIESAT